MFYTTHLQEGNLSLVWLAAHNTKSLKKKETMSCNINDACSAILDGSFALRLSAYLVFGLYKIHNKQASFLLQDYTVTVDKCMFGKRKVRPHQEHPPMDLDLTQQDMLQVDDDMLMETLSLSAQSLDSIELQRGIAMDSLQLDTLPLDFNTVDEQESIELARRDSINNMQGSSILPVPLEIDAELRSEEKAFSEQHALTESLPDLQLDNSMEFPSLLEMDQQPDEHQVLSLNPPAKQHIKSRKRKRQRAVATNTNKRYFDTVIDDRSTTVLNNSNAFRFDPTRMADPMLRINAFQSATANKQEASPLVSEHLESHEALDMSIPMPEMDPPMDYQEEPVQFEEAPLLSVDQPEIEVEMPQQQVVTVAWQKKDSFFEKTKSFNKQQVVRAFIGLLNGNFDLEQEEPFGDILVV